VAEFRYLETILTIHNFIHYKIKSRKSSENIYYRAVRESFSAYMLSDVEQSKTRKSVILFPICVE
jgi:hypothetical protein